VLGVGVERRVCRDRRERAVTVEVGGDGEQNGWFGAVGWWGDPEEGGPQALSGTAVGGRL